MNTHADIRSDNKSQSVANAISKKQDNAVSTFQLVDNRPKQIAQLPKKDLITPTPSVFQLQKLEAGKLNVVGEHHTESNNRRPQEKDIADMRIGNDTPFVGQNLEDQNLVYNSKNKNHPYLDKI